MIIKVVSLKKAIDRRKHIFQEFLNLRLPFDFMDAIDPSSCSKEILKNFCSNKFELLYGRLPTLPEVGASISHDLARKKFLKVVNQKTLLVLEDDAKIMCTNEELLSVVKVFEQSKFDIFILGFSKCDDEFEKHTSKKYKKEPRPGIKKRVESFLDSLPSKPKHIIIVTHDGIMGVVQELLTGPFPDKDCGDLTNGKNCSIMGITKIDKKFKLISFANTEHLKLKL